MGGLAHLSGLAHLDGMLLSFHLYDIFYPTLVGWLLAENDVPFDMVSNSVLSSELLQQISLLAYNMAIEIFIISNFITL